MFYLSWIDHTLRLPPHLLNLPLDEAIKEVLESLFLDKVIPQLGLCVSVYDIQSIEGGFIFPAHGASTYTVKFRLVMFRPFVGEVIMAKLKESTASGLRLTLGFFEDIIVPDHLMPTPSHCVPDPKYKNEVKWIWDYGEPADDSAPAYTVDRHDEIRFRVQAVTYPSKKEDSKLFSPMVVTGLLDADGLGPVQWWSS